MAKGNVLILQERMCFALSLWSTSGTRQIRTLQDYWTVVSKDGKPSAHYEHTVVVRKERGEALTDHAIIEAAIKNNKDLSEISLKI